MGDELFVPNQYKILQVFHDVTKLRFQLTDLSNPPFELNTDSIRMPWAVLAPGVSCPYLDFCHETSNNFDCNLHRVNH